MKQFKKIDFYFQLVLLIAFVAASNIFRGDTFFIGYFAVGAWQVTSMGVHYYNEWHMHKYGRRYYYTIISGVAILLLAVAFIFPQALFPLLFLMLFAAPVMALYYLSICYQEVFKAYKRPSETII